MDLKKKCKKNNLCQIIRSINQADTLLLHKTVKKLFSNTLNKEMSQISSVTNIPTKLS